jgi:transcriptional regulator with XRE-family HTH domain
VAIGLRLRTLREQRRLSRADLHILGGVDAKACERAELGIAPLRYESAYSFLVLTRKSVRWLATGEGDPDEFIELPNPDEIGKKRRLRLSVFFDECLGPELRNEGKDVWKRFYHLMNTIASARKWYSFVPDDRLDDLATLIHSTAKKAVESGPEPSWQDWVNRTARLRNMELEDWRKRILQFSALENRLGGVKDIRSLPELLQQLRAATSNKGGMARLAKALHVRQARVSEWLRTEKPKVPSGDIVFRLLQWLRSPKPKPQRKNTK